MAPALSYSRILHQTRTTAFVLRCGGLFLLSIVYLVQPSHTAIGLWTFGVLAVWTGGRLADRRYRAWATWVDWALVLVIAANFDNLTGALPPLSVDCPALAAVGTAVLSLAVELRYWASLPAVGAIMVAFWFGVRDIAGVDSPFGVYWLYYFASQWVVVGAVRLLVERAAHSADDAAQDYARARALASARRAARRMQREHWATLHDTAAATLMMIGSGVVVSADRLRSQARRDIAALRDLPATSAAETTNIRAAVSAVAATSPIDVQVTGGHGVAIPADIAAAVTGAVREALTNVERHSGVRRAQVVIEANSVVVADAGVGFDPRVDGRSRPGHGRGLSESIVGRMADVGGAASVESTPGGGTTVELAWTPPDDVDRAVTLSIRRAARISRIFHYGMVFVAVLYMVMFLVGAVGTGRLYAPTQYAFGVLALAVIAVGARNVLVAPLPPAAVAAGLVVVAFVVGAQSFTTRDFPGSQTAWAGGVLGFTVVLLMLHQSLWRISIALVCCWMPNLVSGAVKGQFTDPSVVSLVSTAIGNVGVQIVVAGWILALATNARRAAQDGAAMARILEAEEVAAQVADDHRLRYESLSTTTIPLLEALADGVVEPSTLRGLAAIESARLRRMFAATETARCHFHAEIFAVVTEAEEKGVTVSVDIDDDVEIPRGRHCDTMVAAVGALLASAESFGRVVVTADPIPEMSVVCDADGVDVGGLDGGLRDLHVRSDAVGGTSWVEIRWETTMTAVQDPATVPSR